MQILTRNDMMLGALKRIAEEHARKKDAADKGDVEAQAKLPRLEAAFPSACREITTDADTQLRLVDGHARVSTDTRTLRDPPPGYMDAVAKLGQRYVDMHGAMTDPRDPSRRFWPLRRSGRTTRLRSWPLGGTSCRPGRSKVTIPLPAA